RYLCVDPRNRLVAQSLEQSWNEKLQLQRNAEDEYEKSKHKESDACADEVGEKLDELLKNFPAVWNDRNVTNRDRKRVVRLIVEDGTLLKNTQQQEINAHIRFKGGATRSVKLDTPWIVYERWKTKPHIIEEIDRLLDDHTEGQVARLLTERGMTTSYGRPFRTENVAYLRKKYGLRHRSVRLQERGYLPLREIAASIGVSMLEIKRREAQGLIESVVVNDLNKRLYRETPKTTAPPVANLDEAVSEQEVQYA
ncbi:MAG: recombinase family protein, partial [Gammaproteobacteria bacterium]|nr:recombinase family protein [Gammaproteobacteria bacterium]